MVIFPQLSKQKIFYEFHRVGKQHLYIGVQYLRENVAHGKEDKLGHKMNRVDLIKFIKEVGFSVLGSTLLEAKDNYQNEILMLKKNIICFPFKASLGLFRHVRLCEIFLGKLLE